ncbi:cysteine protease StiP family protein [Paenibacillus sp. FSL W8-0187]|uniref:cysteine protease StiP family protein n=1 Tax=unclassified Paenibacillus TaxID=185978 RepID=UPI0030D7FE8F
MTVINRIIPAPAPLGSYKNEDVVFLLKDLSDIPLEKGNEDREVAIQSGTHYSEMLPVEYQPTDEYIQLFHSTLAASAQKVAAAAAVTAELIVRKRGFNTIIASLARAGTPVGILIKRYIKMVYNHDLPHYSISIIRGRGIDENALLFMLQNHSGLDIQFVDGWTGKGAIRNVLIEACNLFEDKYGITLSDDLAVLADPGCCSTTFGTREDFLIPSACLNSTVSGLMSRTVLHKDLIGPNEFHGAKYYKEWLPNDVSNLFVDHISNQFKNVIAQAKAEADTLIRNPSHNIATWQGMKDIRRIQEEFGIENVDLVKPGIGETTRVLLRRVPWKILVNRLDNPNLKHILLLAKERNVPVEMYPELTYSCCGIIKPLKGGEPV